MSGHWAPKIKKENIICFLNSYCSRKWNRISMGIINSKDLKKKINEATSNTSLSNLRYVITEKPKWKVFKKREVTAIPAYHTSLKPLRGCPCGNNSPCKQKVTPRGVTIHYPQKKKKFRTLAGKSFKSPKVDKGYLSTNPRPVPKVKLYRPKKFTAWRLDKITYNTPYLNPTSPLPSTS
ncbi:uncharacterized protein LOC135084481 [Ostrinia nubilalis]|uniref:uncharacterized protein LOC135084481 n=1 Tax=Ostrinia nubilalis TaxID=29057 RepID=UPI00103947D6|nr:uncharacterized protein LOC114366495 isoform X2 [Ostrinia furnacalis]